MSETNRIEHKRELTKDLDIEKEVIAFLNYQEGGIFYIGIDKDGSIRYRARQQDCQTCTLRQRCTPNMPARKVTRSVYEGARDLTREITASDAYRVSSRQRKKVEMLFAHLKRILKLDRLRLRGPNGAKDEFHLAAAAQNLRKLAKMKPTPGLAPA